MNTSETILVIALSVMLAIFLLLSIIILAQVLKLVSNLRRLAEKAERLVDSAEVVGDIFRKSAGPVGLFRFMRGVAETAMQHKSDQRKK